MADDTTNDAPAVENGETGPVAPPEPPNWINSEFIETALKCEHPDISVTSLNVEAAVGVGENYACIVFRALAQTNHGEYALILKCMPESEFRSKWVRESGIITCEVQMYTEALPLLKGSSSLPHLPHCYHVMQDGTRDTIVLRDLRPEGYRTRLRQLGLDAAHCRLALTQLAHLHGLSAALRVNQPDVFKSKIQSTFYERLYSDLNREKFGPFFNATLTSLAEAVKFKFPFRFYAIADIMIKMSSSVFNQLFDILNVTDEEVLSKRVLVLNHGDFWSNNILFQYGENDDEPLNCSMIDFQVARIGSPVLDILYFLYTSTEQATRRDHLHELLQMYLDEAHKAMRERGVQPCKPVFFESVDEILKEMREYAIFGFLSACFVLPLVIAEAKDAPDLDSFTEEDFQKMEQSPFLKMYSGPLFCRRFQELLEDFDDMGFFSKIEAAPVEENVTV